MKSVKVLLILVMGFMITNQAVAAFVDHIFHYNVSTQPKQIGQSQGAHVVAYHESGFANFGPYHQFPAANRVRNIIACGEFKLESDPLWVPEGHLGTLDLVDWSTGANPQRGFTKYDFKGRNRAIFCAQSQLPVGYTANVEVRWWHTGVAPVRLLNKFFVVTRANVEFTVSNQEPVTISGEAGNHIIMAMNGRGSRSPLKCGERSGASMMGIPNSGGSCLQMTSQEFANELARFTGTAAQTSAQRHFSCMITKFKQSNPTS